MDVHHWAESYESLCQIGLIGEIVLKSGQRAGVAFDAYICEFVKVFVCECGLDAQQRENVFYG